MKHKFDIGDKVFFPSFDFNGFFEKIESGVICSISKKMREDGETFQYVVDTHICTSKDEDVLCATIEEAEKLSVRMALNDIKKRYRLVKNMCEKHNMINEIKEEDNKK